MCALRHYERDVEAGQAGERAERDAKGVEGRAMEDVTFYAGRAT